MAWDKEKTARKWGRDTRIAFWRSSAEKGGTSAIEIK